MEKQKILQELGELLNIPQVERLMVHKVEEMKNIYKDEIDIYFSMRKNYRNNAYGQMYVCEEEEEEEAPNILPIYRFELDRDIHGKWKIADIEPALPKSLHADDIILPFIVQYMTSYDINSTQIETINNFSHPKLKEKKYNIRFTKYSEYHLLGTIAEVQNSMSNASSISNEGKLDNLVSINDCYKNENDDLNYKELMYYLEKYPAFREHTFSEFFMKWKPLIDEDLLKLDT